MRTASGATAVQIAEYVDGRRRIVAHVGSAHTEAELGLLLEQARVMLEDAGQDELDLGVQSTPRMAPLMVPAPVETALFTDPTHPGQSGRVVDQARVGAPPVIGTSSRLLFDVLAEVFDALGFAVVGDETFRDLVIARIHLIGSPNGHHRLQCIVEVGGRRDTCGTSGRVAIAELGLVLHRAMMDASRRWRPCWWRVSGSRRNLSDPEERRKHVDQAQEAAYADYVRAHWRDLVRAAVFLGADLHEAEDLAQTTLVRCYTGWDRVNGADNRDAYVYRMLLNALRDVRRSRWWKSRADLDLDGVVEDRAEARAVADAVQRALSGLSKVNRGVVVLRYFVQLTEAQSAAALGVPVGTVKSRLSRALANLARDRHLQDIGEHS